MDEARIGELLMRIQREYQEMPGLSLTARQAQRLWCLDADACESLLGVLVDARILRQSERGCYVRADLANAARDERLQKLPPRAAAMLEFRPIADRNVARSA
jgi:hypothetical protein